jgi:hypothetical protein
MGSRLIIGLGDLRQVEAKYHALLFFRSRPPAPTFHWKAPCAPTTRPHARLLLPCPAFQTAAYNFPREDLWNDKGRFEKGDISIA